MEFDNISILIAEDDDSERKLIKMYLQKQGYFVIEASTGEEALVFMRQMEPDVIISDLRMPDIDGLKLLEIARKEREMTPFILISGFGTFDDVVLGLRYGAWDYLVKPLHPMELIQHSIDRVLERVRLIQERQQWKFELEQMVEQRTLDLLNQNKSYEQEIRERLAQEKKAQNLLNEWRRTVDALPEMIAIIDRERRIHRFNKPLLSFFKVKAAAIKGAACVFCRDNHKCIQREVVETGKAQKIELYLEEEDKYLELNVVPYSSPDGEFVGTIHVFRDITKRNQAKQEKEQLQAKLLHTQKLESVGQLAAGIAHEINTPTQFVSSNMAFLDDAFSDIKACIENICPTDSSESVSADAIREVLSSVDWGYLKDEVPEAIQQSKEGLQRVTSIVQAMKEFSHPGSKTLERVDINHLIEVTTIVARNEWKYASDVILELDKKLPRVFCLANEMGQVLLNILVNSAHSIQEKFGQNPDKEKGKITIGTSFDDGGITITVEDDGCGIPKKIQDKVFDPFFTTKGVGKGTGQGLAIAYDVVNSKHGGKLSFVSTPGGGSIFNIFLPMETGSSQ